MRLRLAALVLLLLMAPALAASSGSRHFNASYAHLGSAVVTATPLTISCWFRLDNSSDGVKHTLAGVFRASGGTAGQQSGLYIVHNNNGAAGSQPVYAASASTGTFTTGAVTSANVTNTNWHHVMAVFASSTSRTIYLDGGHSGSEATSNTPSSLNDTVIGAFLDPTGAQFDSTNQSEAHCAFWSAALTAAEDVSLANGASPMVIRPVSLLSYAPLWGLASPELDLIDLGHAWTLVSSPTVTASAPPVSVFLPASP